MPNKGSVWFHIKTKNFYEVVGRGKHTETGENLVYYHQVILQENRCLVTRMEAKDEIWARPFEMFVDGRFTEIKNIYDYKDVMNL